MWQRYMGLRVDQLHYLISELDAFEGTFDKKSFNIYICVYISLLLFIKSINYLKNKNKSVIKCRKSVCFVLFFLLIFIRAKVKCFRAIFITVKIILFYKTKIIIIILILIIIKKYFQLTRGRLIAII